MDDPITIQSQLDRCLQERSTIEQRARRALEIVGVNAEAIDRIMAGDEALVDFVAANVSENENEY